MTFTFDTAFVQQFSAVLAETASQQRSRLLRHVLTESFVGKSFTKDVIGTVELLPVTGRYQAPDLDDMPFYRRQGIMQDWSNSVGIDSMDKLRALVDPTSYYTKKLIEAAGRKIDDVIITAMLGGASQVAADGTVTQVTLPSSQIVTEDYGTANSNMTFAKLQEAKKKLLAAEVPEDEIILVLNADAVKSLLSEQEVTSWFYNQQRPLEDGEISEFYGVKMIRLERLPGVADGTDTNPVKCFMFQRDALILGMATDGGIKGRVVDATAAYNVETWKALVQLNLGAVRLEEKRVVRIDCVQSA